MCFYDVGLWSFFRVGTLNKLAAAYVRYIDFLWLLQVCQCYLYVVGFDHLGLPSFTIIIFNASVILIVDRLLL